MPSLEMPALSLPSPHDNHFGVKRRKDDCRSRCCHKRERAFRETESPPRTGDQLYQPDDRSNAGQHQQREYEQAGRVASERIEPHGRGQPQCLGLRLLVRTMQLKIPAQYE